MESGWQVKEEFANIPAKSGSRVPTIMEVINLANRPLQLGDKVLVKTPVTVHTVNRNLGVTTTLKGRTREDENGEKETRGRLFQGTVVGLPDNHRLPENQGVTIVRKDGSGESLFFENFTLRMTDGRTAFVNEEDILKVL